MKSYRLEALYISDIYIVNHHQVNHNLVAPIQVHRLVAFLAPRMAQSLPPRPLGPSAKVSSSHAKATARNLWEIHTGLKSFLLKIVFPTHASGCSLKAVIPGQKSVCLHTRPDSVFPHVSRSKHNSPKAQGQSRTPMGAKSRVRGI